MPYILFNTIICYNIIMDFNNTWYNVILSDTLKAEASCMTAKEMSAKYGVSEFKLRQVLRENNIKPLVPKRAEVRNSIAHWARTFNNGRLLSIYYNMRRRHYSDVCDEWKNDCCNFYAWAKESGYKEGVKLYKSGNVYSPANCKWI